MMKYALGCVPAERAGTEDTHISKYFNICVVRHASTYRIHCLCLLNLAVTSEYIITETYCYLNSSYQHGMTQMVWVGLWNVNVFVL